MNTKTLNFTQKKTFIILCLVAALALLTQIISASHPKMNLGSPPPIGQRLILLADIDLNQSYISGYAVDPVNNLLYVGGSMPMSNNNYIAVIDTEIGTQTGIYEGFPDDMNELALSTDGSILFALVDDEILKIDTTSFNILDTYQCNCDRAVDIVSGQDGRLFISSSDQIQVMDESNGNIIGSVSMPNHYSGYDLQIVPSINLLFAMQRYYSSTNYTLYKFDISGDNPVQLASVDTEVGSAQFNISADGSYAIVVGGTVDSGTLKQYSVENFDLLNTIDNNNEFTLADTSIDSQLIYAVTSRRFYSGFLRAFDANTGSEIMNYWIGGGGHTFMTTLGEDKIAVGTLTSYVRLFVPSTHGLALPMIYNNYCPAPYIDDFSDPNSGWPVSVSGSTTYQYIDGEYEIYHDDANKWVGVTIGHVMENTETVVIEGRLANNHDGVLGLVFGLNNDWSNFYTFEILPQHQIYAILHYNSQTGWSTISSGNSTAINTDSQVNELKIRGTGSSQNFYINDTYVTWTDMHSGHVGISGGSFESNVRIRYDNYLFADDNCPIPMENPVNSAIESSSDLNNNHPVPGNLLNLNQD